jgi:hypothetical protein
MRRPAVLGAVALLVMVAGCGGGGGHPAATAPRAATSVATAPNPATGKPRSPGRPQLPPPRTPPSLSSRRVPPGSALAKELTRSARQTGLRVCGAAPPAQLAKALHARAPTLRSVAHALAARYPPQFRQAAVNGCLAAHPAG